jgi:hypothetical protein
MFGAPKSTRMGCLTCEGLAWQSAFSSIRANWSTDALDLEKATSEL